MAAESLRAHPRSAISRAYYAAYSVVSDALVKRKGVAFAPDRRGPNHGAVPGLIATHLKGKLSREDIKDTKAAIRRLYFARLEADYQPHQAITQHEARKAVFDARLVLRKFGLI